jgi:arylesterase/paraoxonase
MVFVPEVLTVGFDYLETSPGNILIYAINHRRTGSMIERFHHTIGTRALVYEKSFECHNKFCYTPNDIAVVGKDEFYVTNVFPALIS